MNAYCNAEFPGSHICNDFEWAESTPFDPVPASGAWLEFSNTDNTRSGTGGCNGWTAGTSVGGYTRVVATQTGGIASNPTTTTCGSVLPIACCRSRTSAVFRGITAYTTTGAPSGPGLQQGRLSMNARCRAEFPGSHICNDFEWAEATPNLPVPASGAWLEFSNTDNTRSSTGGCNGWTAGTSTGGYTRVIATQTGGVASNPTTTTCGSVLPIACCE